MRRKRTNPSNSVRFDRAILARPKRHQGRFDESSRVWSRRMDQGAVPVEGDAVRAMVEAIGEPGQRRFRLVALIDGTTCVIWMEKQQLQALGIALEQVLDQLDDVSVVVDGGQPPIAYDLDTRQQFR